MVAVGILPVKDRRNIRRVSFWAKLIPVSLIFIIPLSSLSFPKVVLPGIHAIDAGGLASPAYAESSYATILPLLNSTSWNLNAGGQTGYFVNRTPAGLVFGGSLPASSSPSSIAISGSLSVNLTRYPIMYMLTSVSADVSYGIRFDARSSGGNSFPVWTDGDYLNHRPGQGRLENVQVNMMQMAEANSGRIVDNMSRVKIYVERSASSQPTAFSLELKKFEFLNFPLEPAGSTGSYHALYLDVNIAQLSSSSYLETVNVQGRMNGTPGARVVLYLVRGLTVYGGDVYSFDQSNPEISYTIHVSEQGLRSFSDNLPIRPASVVIVAGSGSLTKFTFRSLTLNYFFRTAQTSATQQNISPLVYDSLFLILLPVSVVMLSLEYFRNSKKAQSLH